MIRTGHLAVSGERAKTLGIISANIPSHLKSAMTDSQFPLHGQLNVLSDPPVEAMKPSAHR